MKLKWDFRVAIAILLGCFLPYFSYRFIPTHDTFHQFQVFHYFYSQLFFHHDLPLWIPYENYGIPSAFHQMSEIRPSAWFVMAIGLILKIKNALFLYKASTLFDLVVLASGVFAFGRLYFRNRPSTLYAVVGICLSIYWMRVDSFNLAWIYLLPWAIYCIGKGISERKLIYVGLAGIIFLITAIGNIAYFLVPIFYTLFLYAISYFFLTLGKKEKFKWDRYLAVCGLFLLVLGLSILITYSKIFDQLIVLAPGRTSEGTTTLENFLTHTSYKGELIFDLAFSGLLPFEDYSHFMGFFALPLFGFALFREKKAAFRSFLIPILFLSLISWGGYFAQLAWKFLPGFKFFRHIGHLHSIIKVLIFLGAGFGFDLLIDWIKSENGFNKIKNVWNEIKKSKHILIILILVSFGILDYWVAHVLHTRNSFTGCLTEIVGNCRSLEFLSPLWGFYIRAGIILIFLLAVCKIRKLEKPDYLITVITFVSILEFVIWHYSVSIANARSPMSKSEIEKWFGVRSIEPLSLRSNEVGYPLFFSHDRVSHFSGKYSFENQFLNRDSCLPFGRSEIYEEKILDLINVRKVDLGTLQTSEAFGIERKIFGCTESKLILWDELSLHQQTSPADDLTSLNSLESAQVVVSNLKGEVLIGKSERQMGVNPESISANQVIAKIHAVGEHSILTYADAFDLRWSVFVDGKPAESLRAFRGFKGVELNRGDHLVRWEISDSRWIKFSRLFILGSILFSLVQILVWIRIFRSGNFKISR